MDTFPFSGLVPIPRTSFIGRNDELELARRLLGNPQCRMLTLTGPGGIGKTRLAIEIAHRLGVDYPDGVIFIPLAAVPLPALVLPAIGSALGLREFGSGIASDAIVIALGRSRRLLVIDNLEHLLEAAPELSHLLNRCPNIKLLATSRSLLRIEGEQALPVPPLGVPDLSKSVVHGELLQSPALRFFIERAQAIEPAREWNTTDIAQLIEICSRLDGLPLALELAATRTRHLTLTEIRDRLDERLSLLVDGSRDHPNRLRTMRNAIAWSHDLLLADAQVLFRRASVFQSGFTLDTIEGLLTQLDTPIEADASILDRLAPLIDASLLTWDIDPLTGGARYRMLETIREYAGELLAQSHELDATRQAHAVVFTHFAERYALADLMPSSVKAIERLTSERANLGAALAWLDTISHTEHFLRLIAALGNFWTSTANYREATYWYERALAHDEQQSPTHRARIQVQAGMTRLLLGDIGDAEPLLAAGLTACRDFDEPYHATLALLGLANVAVLYGDNELATQRLLASRETAGAIADQRLAEIAQGMVSLNLGVVSRATGNTELAREQISDMLRRARAADYLQGTLLALGDLGDLERDRAEWASALLSYREALALGRQQPIRRTVIEIIESVAIVAFRTDQIEQSAMLAGAAESLRERTGLRYIQPESNSSLHLAISGSRTALGETAFEIVWDAGRALSASAAIDSALTVQARASASLSIDLTPREIEITRLLVQGMTDPEIAETLFLSVRTVENHVAHILAKFDVHTRTAAVSAAIAVGLVSPGSASPSF